MHKKIKNCHYGPTRFNWYIFNYNIFKKPIQMETFYIHMGIFKVHAQAKFFLFVLIKLEKG